MKNVLLLVGVLGLGAGAWLVYQYMYTTHDPTDRSNLIYGGICLFIALVCFAVFFFKRFREEGDQDISITKF